ncbi:hypothetical protein [Rhizobium leguminosarum]|uniref:hypothetical protein n=1 Tax=Rhizobium leguminosarum TaxID=384 RepID=UPI0010319EA5|nr:hypothetical protein [Rhizobium leguminosarum]TBF89117.1 hypothetical protein ELG82_36855 [Rhizobium leguminosarum]
MQGSIYEFVKKKLISHGVSQTPDGLVTLENKLLFLDFVQLERAVRNANFDAVQSAVKRIDERVRSLGKRHLIVFAYLYLFFSDGTPERTHTDTKDDGVVLRSVEYRRAVTPEERLIADWGSLWFERCGKSLLRAVYASKT